ncbi:hypothetical protein ARSEF4850_000224 [Beauveria asiatica]
MMASLLAFALYGLAALPSVSADANTPYCSVLESTRSTLECRPLPNDFLQVRGASTFASASASASSSASASASSHSTPDVTILQDTFKALADLQNDYFKQAHKTWPDAIDWTAAVIQTIVSSTMSTLTQSLDAAVPGQNWEQKENLVSFLHEQIVSSFFGQRANEILTQAYDDVLWVVLGWIEAIKFRRLHEDLHYPQGGFSDKSIPEDITQAVKTMTWHGQFWVDSFAHRANDFWAYSTTGWDTKFCQGGMNWNPRLEMYKNAITNELYIAGSIAMYQHFPGDRLNGTGSRDPRHLQAAKDGYQWLMNVNMTNSQGLFVDGFHINRNIPGNTKCDERDEMVYTYNQGVILTGNRGLFSVTGDPSYVEHGHRLVRSVIAATGWDLQSGKPVDGLRGGQLPPWHGLGRYGYLEDQCDASATCSQDSQTFKGIYFHHLTAFCRPLELTHGNTEVNEQALVQVRQAHAASCRRYINWIKHNADAALKTRDSNGHFGMWWGANVFNVNAARSADGIDHFAANKTDYRNEGTPQNQRWGVDDVFVPGGGNATTNVGTQFSAGSGDANSRGRGRTVETQAGGLALLRAYWEISQS